MNIGETLDSLINADNYAEVRVKISDRFIEMAKILLPDYRFIEQKEKDYQKLISGLKQMNSKFI